MTIFNPQKLDLPGPPAVLGGDVEILYVLQNGGESHHLNRWHDFRLAQRDCHEILGAVNAKIMPDRVEVERLDRFEIDRLWVPRTLRRKGVGSYLIALAKAVAKQRGCRVIQGVARPFDGSSMEDLTHFYTKHGFALDVSSEEKDVFELTIAK
jgi:GNAT superfamily N-acetyltransferase